MRESAEEVLATMLVSNAISEAQEILQTRLISDDIIPLHCMDGVEPDDKQAMSIR